MSISDLRQQYHRLVCGQILSIGDKGPNISDVGNRGSIDIANELIRLLGHPITPKPPEIQRIGKIFEDRTGEFLQQSFSLLQHLRPGRWTFSIHDKISKFDQYSHLAQIKNLIDKNRELSTIVGQDYLIVPDILVGRQPVLDTEINRDVTVVDEIVGRMSPLRASNHRPVRPLLHAIISCKWTLRSDRAQQIRLEGQHLIRLRKGHTPHIVAVAAEPLPTRLASLALGTGDLDCVYHFALPELREAVNRVGNQDQREMLSDLIELRRLRDISDLPLDLAV